MKPLILIVILLSLGGNTLFAQSRLSERIENNLKQLARKIEQIRILAERYDNQQALNTITSAREDFDEAVAFLQQWKDNRNKPGLLEQARAKYQSANLKADLASRILLFKPAANLLAELERLIQQAESVVQGSDANDIRYYLNKARNYYKLAQNAFASNRYLRGHEYLKIATYFAQKVIDLARGNQNSDRGLPFEEFKNNIQMLLDRVSADINEDPILQGLYNRIQEYLLRAGNAYSRGNLKRAFSNLKIAERLTYRIIDLAEDRGERSPAQQAEEEYQSLNRYLTTLRNELDREQQQSRVLDKAEEFYLKAGRNIENNQFQQALTNLKLAQRMALRVSDRISSTGIRADSENMQKRINEIQHLINLQENRIEKSEITATHILLEHAREFFHLGQQEYENTDFKLASYYFNITLRLLNSNESILKQENPQNIAAKTVLQDINKTEQLINRLKLNTSLEYASQAKISVLQKLLVNARDAYDNSNYVIARDIIIIIQNQLTQMPNN